LGRDKPCLEGEGGSIEILMGREEGLWGTARRWHFLKSGWFDVLNLKGGSFKAEKGGRGKLGKKKPWAGDL